MGEGGRRAGIDAAQEGGLASPLSETGGPAGRSDLGESLHPRCIVCGARNARGLRLQFTPFPDGQGVTADFDCDRSFEGYPGVVHGGIVSALLDGAMTHCLFQSGRAGRTARLTVRFRHPVIVGRRAIVSARLVAVRGRVLDLTAELAQGGRIAAEAQGRFLG